MAVVAALVAIAADVSVEAAHISEPNTVLYGRIVERVGEREFPFTTGQLVWNLRTTGPGGKDYQLKAQLAPLGEGRYSYRLSIPHEVLAYDLTVNTKAIGLASAGTQVRHLSVTLDGKTLTLSPSAVDGFSVNQSLRASAQRIDLALSTNSPDSDSDGLPDWWEDQNGFDKYDPTDATKAGGSSDTATPAASSEAQTFAEWRAVWFPGSTGDLNAFGQEDADKDGIPNILEYAFDLNPTQVEANVALAVPHACTVAGQRGVAFRKRANATDIDYQIEISDDLFQWKDGTSALRETANPAAEAPQSTAFVETGSSTQAMHRFFRVRVNRR